MDLSKQEMDKVLQLPGLWSKNVFYKMFFIWSNGFKLIKQEMELFHPLPGL